MCICRNKRLYYAGLPSFSLMVRTYKSVVKYNSAKVEGVLLEIRNKPSKMNSFRILQKPKILLHEVHEEEKRNE